jgi:hypothetical protein
MSTKHLVVGVNWYGPYSLAHAQKIAHEYGKEGLYLCLGKQSAPGRDPHKAEAIYLSDGLGAMDGF